MIKFKKDFNVKIISLFVAVLFLFNSTVYGIDLPRNTPPNNLRVPLENSYERMLEAMQKEYKEHEATDEGIKKLAIGKHSKSLSDIKVLETEFMAIIEAGGLKAMLKRLYAVFDETQSDGIKPRIQIIFVDSINDLPKFKREPVWGHAGTFITVFAVREQGENEEAVENSGDIRKRIIGRIFHEIRARSTRAEEIFKERNPKSIEDAEGLREEFEKVNIAIEKEVAQKGFIESQDLLQEFQGLEFAPNVSKINRDYAVTEEQIIEELKSKGVRNIRKLGRRNYLAGDIPISVLVEDNSGPFSQLPGLIADPDADDGRVRNYVKLKGSAAPLIRVCCFSWLGNRFLLLAGYHRTAAAVIRGDKFISATIEYDNPEGSPPTVFQLLSTGKLSYGESHTRKEIAEELGLLSDRKPFSERTIQLDLAFLVKAGVIERVKIKGVVHYQLRPELKGDKSLIIGIQDILDREFKDGMITKNLRIPENRERIAAEILSIIIPEIFRKGPITVNDVVTRLNVPETVAKRALELLVENRVLIREQVGEQVIYNRSVPERETIESYLSIRDTQTSDYLSFNYKPLGDEEKRLIATALPNISKRKTITIKSIGIGGEGHELYETAQIITEYLIEHNIRDVKIQLIAYDKIKYKLESAIANISRKLQKLHNIQCRYVLIDLNDKEQYEVLVREKADILFCRYTWLALQNNWDFNRQQEFSKLLTDNVNEGGVVYITGLGGIFSVGVREIRTEI